MLHSSGQFCLNYEPEIHLQSLFSEANPPLFTLDREDPWDVHWSSFLSTSCPDSPTSMKICIPYHLFWVDDRRGLHPRHMCVHTCTHTRTHADTHLTPTLFWLLCFDDLCHREGPECPIDNTFSQSFMFIYSQYGSPSQLRASPSGWSSSHPF